MSYKHILVAVDISQENRQVIEKAVKLARPLGAKISLIHIDDQATDDFLLVEDLKKKLDELATDIDYPIEDKIIAEGDLSHGIQQTVADTDVDLVICGHHHNFWSRLIPSSGELLDHSPVDLLIIPLKE